MKRLPFTLSTALVLLSFVGAPALAAGQTSGGPSLADTLQFITATVAAQGPVSFSGVVHDPAANTSWSYSRTVTLTNFVADAAACKLSFHFSEQTPGNPNTETDGRLPFSGIQQVKVESLQDELVVLDAKAGHAQWQVVLTPQIYVVSAQRPDGTTNDFDFYNSNTAQSVGKAVQHAVDLCGGGKSPF